MIRAILHLPNDQPLSVDLDQMPAPSDTSLVCRNVRTLDGKKPVFIDFTDSTFVFPYSGIRFLEIPSLAAPGESRPSLPERAESETEDLEIDEDFLRRVREA